MNILKLNFDFEMKFVDPRAVIRNKEPVCFFFFFLKQSHYLAQAGLELLSSVFLRLLSGWDYRHMLPCWGSVDPLPSFLCQLIQNPGTEKVTMFIKGYEAQKNKYHVFSLTEAKKLITKESENRIVASRAWEGCGGKANGERMIKE